MEDVKIKLAVLWLFYVVAFLAVVTLVIFEPGVIADIMKGEIYGEKIGPELLLVVAILLLVPLVMAFLSLTLKDSTNRWANIIVGIVFTGFQLVALIETLVAPSAYAYAILMEISKTVVPALIAWYAWKWPKKKD